jgi:hypothetical protein
MCLLRLSREGESASLITKTENIGGSGFYCLVPKPFFIGDRLQCEIHIPVHRFSLWASEMRLTCKATVTQVQEMDRDIGIDCEFEDFTVAIG